jgi:hypothetical protein
MMHNARPNPVEPSYNDRQVAHLEQGFSEQQAMDLTQFAVKLSFLSDEYDEDTR